MSTLYVTIGGKEVDLTSGGTLLSSSHASVRSATARPERRSTNGWPGRTAALIGLFASLSLVIVLVVWLGAFRKRAD